MTDIVLVVLAVLLVVIQEFFHSRERRDLYSRMMAKDLTEYKDATGTPRPPPKSKNFVAAGLRRYFNREAGD